LAVLVQAAQGRFPHQERCRRQPRCLAVVRGRTGAGPERAPGRAGTAAAGCERM